MLGFLKGLVAPAKVEQEIKFTVPDMGDKASTITTRQKEYLELLGIPAPAELSENQAGLLLSCANYIMFLFEQIFTRPKSKCPHTLFLRMLPMMLDRKDIRDYILEWNSTYILGQDNDSHPFRGRENNPIHKELRQVFAVLCREYI